MIVIQEISGLFFFFLSDRDWLPLSLEFGGSGAAENNGNDGGGNKL